MDEKDNSMRPRVVINGDYTPASAAGLAHRVYRYHVDIHHPALGQPVAFDRELHIREPCRDTAQTARQAAAPVAVARQAVAAADKDRPAEPVVEPAKDHPDSDPGSTAPEAKQSEGNSTTAPKASITQTPPQKAIDDRPAPRVRAASLRQRLSRIKSRLLETHYRIRGVVPGIRRRIVLPDLKLPPTRRIFSTRAGRPTGRAVLLTGVVLTAVLLFYYVPWSTISIPSWNSTAKSDPAVEEHTAEQDYHAVIEKRPDGVVITIQGPEHETVLTKLPPGYHPVVQDNKIVHVVTPGNTLWFIAKRYIKNPYRYPELARLNKIQDPDLIYPGDRVVIQHIRKP